MQNNNYIDIAQYYCLSVDSRYNGMMNLRTDAFTPVMHVFWAFNKIYRAENQLKSESLMIEPSILASIDKNGKIYILLSNYQRCIGRANEFEIIGAENKVAKIYKLTDKCGFVFQREFALDSEHNLYTEPNGIYYVEI